MSAKWFSVISNIAKAYEDAKQSHENKVCLTKIHEMLIALHAKHLTAATLHFNGKTRARKGPARVAKNAHTRSFVDKVT